MLGVSFGGDRWGCTEVENLVGIRWVIWSKRTVLDGKDGRIADCQRALYWSGFRGISGIHTSFKKWLEGTSNPHAVRSSQGRVRQLPLFPAIAMA